MKNNLNKRSSILVPEPDLVMYTGRPRWPRRDFKSFAAPGPWGPGAAGLCTHMWQLLPAPKGSKYQCNEDLGRKLLSWFEQEYSLSRYLDPLIREGRHWRATQLELLTCPCCCGWTRRTHIGIPERTGKSHLKVLTNDITTRGFHILPG